MFLNQVSRQLGNSLEFLVTNLALEILILVLGFGMHPGLMDSQTNEVFEVLMTMTTLDFQVEMFSQNVFFQVSFGKDFGTFGTLVISILDHFFLLSSVITFGLTLVGVLSSRSEIGLMYPGNV